MVIADRAVAQDSAMQAPPTASAMREGGPPVQAGDTIDFAADTLVYDQAGDVVTATGHVEVRRDGWRLTSDSVEYDRRSGGVTAVGHVITTDPNGNQALAERAQLSESLKDGAIDNILLVLNDGGRLAAQSARRVGGVTILNRAVYSPCPVLDDGGCPKTPVWQLKALRITHNPAKHRISYRDVSLDILGQPILFLPTLTHPDGTAERAAGLVVPNAQILRSLGLGLSTPFYIPLGTDRDVTISPWAFTGANPALQVQARRLFAAGPVQLDTYVTYSRFVDVAADGTTPVDRGDRIRGYFAVHGQLQHNPEWRSTFSVRLTTDDTFNSVYGLNYDDTLRSNYTLERFRSNSYLAISAWGFQGLRLTDRGGEIPFVLPLIDYDWRPTDMVLGGRFHIGANSMNLARTNGQSVRRALAFVRWDRLDTLPFGVRLTSTAMVRGDLYNTSDPDKATLPIYAGSKDFAGRLIPVGALDAEWPLAGPMLGGVQTLTPRVQLVASPSGQNNGIPNEDSRAIELEDINLFDLNRFPGYDRWEGGTRVTYGVTYTLDIPHWALRAEVGQSARLDRLGDDFPAGTGLSGNVSDILGRTSLKYRSLVELTHRYRLDKSTLAVRRNEIDLTLGTKRSYINVGYVRLNRNIQLEDLQDREEVQISARLAFARYWSLFGSAIVDLTTTSDNPSAAGNGYQPIRHRIGVGYEDDCFRFGVSWRRDYISDRDFRAGNSFLFYVAFKNLGT